MSDSHQPHGGVAHGDEEPGFFERPRNLRVLFGVFYVLCALLVVADFLVHRHMEHPWEHLPDFYALYGFLSIVVLVLAAKVLRRVVMRSEDYYDVG